MVKKFGREAEKFLGNVFSVIDSTEFTTWRKELVEFHLLVRVAESTIYPAGVCFNELYPAIVTKRTLVFGKEE